MKLTDEQVAEFRRIYKEAYGEDMPPEEARMWVVRLVRLYRVLLSPTPREAEAQLAKQRKHGTLKSTPPVERPASSPHPF